MAIEAGQTCTVPSMQVHFSARKGAVMKSLQRAVFLLGLLVCGVVAQAQVDSLLLVVNRGPKVLSIFKVDGANLTLVKKLAVGEQAREVCVSPAGDRAYVSNGKDKSITVIDLNKLETIATISDPQLD